jgi:hypothetical protein
MKPACAGLLMGNPLEELFDDDVIKTRRLYHMFLVRHSLASSP